MRITTDKAVSHHCTLKDQHGNTLDSSDGGDPLTYLHGRGHAAEEA